MSPPTEPPRDEGNHMHRSRIEAFVSRNGDYYAGKWAAAEQGEENPSFGFNLAAFFLSSFWLVYRRLYIHLVVFILLIIADVMITTRLESLGILSSGAIQFWDRTSPFIYGSVIGLFANRWYYRRFKAAEASAITLFTTTPQQLNHLRIKGGTNAIGVFVLLFATIAIVYWLIAGE